MTDIRESPRHGSSPHESPATKDQHHQPHSSVSQADGTSSHDPKGETQAQPAVKSETPEGRDGRIHPSAPNDATSEMPANPTRDSAGEVGEPSGQGTLDAPQGITGPSPTPDRPSTEGAGDLRRKRSEDDQAA